MYTQIIWHHCVCTGGITTLVDMPLNSFPSTVSQETLKLKVWTEEQQITLFFITHIFLLFYYYIPAQHKGKFSLSP